MTPSPPQRSQFIDIVKGILMISVVCGHTEVAMCAGEHAPWLRSWFSMGGWNMPAFMAIAGWFFWFSVQKRSFGELVKNKCLCILLPAMFWEIVGKSISLVRNHFAWESLRLMPGLWFLWSILLCILLAAVCYRVGKKWSFRVESCVAASIAVGLYLTPYSVFNIAYTFPFFYGGYVAHRMGLIRYATAGRCLSFMGLTVLLALWNCYSGCASDVSVWVSGTYLFGPLGWPEHLLWNVYRLFLGAVGTIGFIGTLFVLYRVVSRCNLPTPAAGFISFVCNLGCYSLALYAVQNVVVEILLNWAMRWYVYHCNPVNVFHDYPLLFARVVLPCATLLLCWLCMVCIRLLSRYPLTAKICTGKG